MGTCFVIQPFDAGQYDKRHDDVLVPAICAADLEPYRVDRDPSASVPIEQIESGIRAASVCLADITEDNPNVWFELGYAIAARKDVVLICSTGRTGSFPFDVQHRAIIKYATESTRDFDELKNHITERIRSFLNKQEKLGGLEAASSVADIEGLDQKEVVALVAIGQFLDDPRDDVSAYLVRQDMEKAGFTRIATTLAVTSLIRKGLVTSLEAQDHRGESYVSYKLEQQGMDWLLANEDRLVLKRSPATEPAAAPEGEVPF